jgi:hypothetical protein
VSGAGVTGGLDATTARGAVAGGCNGRWTVAADVRDGIVVGEIVLVGGSVVVGATGGATASAGKGTAAARCPLRPGKAWAAMAEKTPVSATPATTTPRVIQDTRLSPASRAATEERLGMRRLSRSDLKER